MPEYPGLGLPLRHFPQQNYGFYPMGAHGNCWGADSDILPVREVAMMIIMDRLMDKEDWHKKVFDDEIVSKWRKEALEYPDNSLWQQATGGKVNKRWADQDFNSATSGIKPLTGIISNEAVDYCVQELRNKAQYYQKSGLIPTLDASATVIKSDRFISLELKNELRNAFDKLKADQTVSPDWHPNSDDMVQDLIHPSMYPLVYDRSKGFKEEVVGVKDAIDKYAGKGEVIAKEDSQSSPNGALTSIGGSIPPPNFWSDTYQWLPSNVAFQNDGSVKFTSYINNLHPNKYPDIYHTIEKMINRAVPAWDQCLSFSGGNNEKVGAGRESSRFSRPANPDDENMENWNPSDPKAVANEEFVMEEDNDEFDWIEDETERNIQRKWHALRNPVQPQPDTFEDDEDDEDVYIPDVNELLSGKFKDSGLQIIVKMASIELTPEKPEFPVGGWHVEGQMNERICATALYYLDSSNISPSELSFRMQTSAYISDEFDVGQDSYHWMQQIYGTTLSGGGGPCLQNYGSVETREGRLLAFPNVFQHRVSPFRLTDPTKPGHRRFIALWLVDPNMRIISTANIPPQQQDWWAESIIAQSGESRADTLSKLPFELTKMLSEKGAVGEGANGKLPPELMEEVLSYFSGNGDEKGLPMSEEEARRHRERLMDVRSEFHLAADDQWHAHSYSFCEH